MNIGIDALKSLKTTGKRLIGAIKNILHDNVIPLIARTTKFVQRSTSRLLGNEFVNAFVLASFDPKSTPLVGICESLKEITPSAKMTPSGLRQRINSPKAQEFLHQTYKHIVESKLSRLSNELNALKDGSNFGALSHFSEVNLHDSTSFNLHESLEDSFKGSGGDASRSQIKLDLIYDIKNNVIRELIVTDWRTPDVALSEKIVKHLKKHSLVIQDLGYFNIAVFECFERAMSYYLSRLKGNTQVYHHHEDTKPVELGKLLQQAWKKTGVVDLEVFISENKIKTRLVAYPVSEQIYSKRMREYRRKYPGRTPSDEYKARQRFTILITNVPKEIWPYMVIRTVYKIRWQIELIFKSWKSQMQIHYIKGTNPERIRCLMYGKLILVALVFTIFGAISNLCLNIGYELSFYKFLNWLKRHGRFAQMILHGLNNIIWTRLTEDLPLLFKELQRDRKTTLQYVIGSVSWFDLLEEAHMGKA